MITPRFKIHALPLIAAITFFPFGGTQAVNTKPPLRTLPIRSLDYTVIFARQMTEMKKFYGETLGFSVVRELGPQWIEYRVGSNILALTERGLMFNDAAPPVGVLSVQLAFRVSPGEVAQVAELLKAKGIKISSGPTDQPWGHRTLFFRDPDGNVLEIYAEL